MFKCHRCGDPTPRLTVKQDHCPRCAAEVAALIAADDRRRNRFAWAKPLEPAR